MNTKLLSAISVVVLLAGCSAVRDSRLNPFNWFGRSTETRTEVVLPAGYFADGRQLVSELLEMKVEPMPGGAVVRALGRTETQGWWNAELVLDKAAHAENPGQMVFHFVIAEPWRRTEIRSPQSREVSVATHVTLQQLDGVRSITVVGMRNSMSARR